MSVKSNVNGGVKISIFIYTPVQCIMLTCLNQTVLRWRGYLRGNSNNSSCAEG